MILFFVIFPDINSLRWTSFSQVQFNHTQPYNDKHITITTISSINKSVNKSNLYMQAGLQEHIKLIKKQVLLVYIHDYSLINSILNSTTLFMCIQICTCFFQQKEKLSSLELWKKIILHHNICVVIDVLAGQIKANTICQKSKIYSTLESHNLQREREITLMTSDK